VLLDFRRRWESPSTRAFAVVALLALLQTSLIAVLLTTQRGAEHGLDVDEAQRARVQHIAYLTLAGPTGAADSGWRDGLRRTADALRAEQRKLYGRSDVAVDAFADAARHVAADPRDMVSAAYVAGNRESLLAALDADVVDHARRNGELQRTLLFGEIAGLVALLATIAVMWLGLVVPSERRAEVAREALEASRARMRSLFMENPESIATLSLDGRIESGNRAMSDLLGYDDARGRHYLDFVAPRARAEIASAFARAAAGERVELETLLRAANGEVVDADVILFPSVIEKRAAGVFVVAKDIRELVRARAAARDQSERITELYKVAAYHGRSWERKVEQALAVAAQRLGYDWAIASEIIDGRARPIAMVGESYIEVGETIPLERSFARFVMHARDVWANDRIADDELARIPGRVRALAAVVGVPIEIGQSVFGAIVMGAERPRRTPLDESDRTFLRLCATLVAATIEDGMQEKQLSAMAFFDLLTGLPNRALLTKRLGDLLAGPRDDAFAVHFVDLDGFKEVNDTFGHAAGDEILRIAAHRMSTCVRAGDTVARLGGDEFVVLQHVSDGRSGASRLADRLLAAYREPFVVDGVAHVVTASIGVSIFPDDARDAVTLMQRADEALYCAKNAGRNRLFFAAA
jgi:diguanylate cyclase (GGDEF)-like protein/PAS domain S-box-containing protein